MQDENGKTQGQIPKFPITIKGWGEKLMQRFDLKDIELIEALIDSGNSKEAIDYVKNHKVNIPFDQFWEKYSYKKGNKLTTKTQWEKLSQDKQRWILDEAIPKYHRYIQVSGISKCQPLVWLRGKRYNDEIPSADRIKRFAIILEKYMEAIDWERKYPQYKHSKPSLEAIVTASEAFMYRYPDMDELDVCGVIKWMVNTWGHEYKHLINPVRAMYIQKWNTYWMNAQKEIQKLKAERAERERKKAMKELNNTPQNEEE